MPACPLCLEDVSLSASNCPHCGAPLPDAPVVRTPPGEKLVSEVRNLLAQGRKIEAIRVYREQTGLGLKTARDAVDAIEQGRPVETSATLPNGAEAELLTMLRDGRKIDAIKRYREHTNAGLADSKAFVESLATRHGLPAQTGCLAAAALLTLIPLLITACLTMASVIFSKLPA